MNRPSSSSRFPQEISNLTTQEFDYAALNSETQIVVQQRTQEIKRLLRRTAQDIFDIGQKLLEVKAQLGHGKFRAWLNAEFDWSVWTATKFMQVADKFKCVKFTHLDVAPSALYELAAPSTPEQARHEAIERASCGETITYSLAKAIKAKTSPPKRELVQPQSAETVTIDISAKTIESNNATVEQMRSDEKYQPPFVGSSSYCSTAPQALDTELDSLCTTLLMNVDYLSQEQINALWQVLVQRTCFEELALLNLSDSQLLGLTAAAQAELSKRQ